MFIIFSTENLILDLLKVFSIHLLISSILYFAFGFFHLSGIYGLGMWTSDLFGLVSSIRFLKSSYSILGLLKKSYGIIIGHHIFSRILGAYISL